MPNNKITFRERGKGQVILLLHGYGGSVHHWEDVANSLAESFRVVVPNLGHLYLSNEKLTFLKQVDALAKFIEVHFPNQKVHLAGLSYGGALAWALSFKYPYLVFKSTLINPMVIDPRKHFLPFEMRLLFKLPLNIKAMYFVLATPFGRAFLKKSALIFRDERSEGSVQVENLRGRKLQFVAYMIHHFFWIIRSEDWTLWQNKLSGDSLAGKYRVIFDKDDLLFSEKSYKSFAELIGCSDIISLSGAGHLASKNCPDQISKHILEFLGSDVAA